MTTLKEMLHDAYRLLHHVPHAKQESQDLIAAALGISRSELFFDRQLDSQQSQRCFDYIRRREQREPLEYITSHKRFMGLDLMVTTDVLIPRVETEILAHRIITTLRNQNVQGKVLWDLCTGSGCLGLALKKAYPELQVYASDCCNKALMVAQDNAFRNHLEIHFLHGDFLEPFSGRCDFFVCNPPYVSEKDFLFLDPEVNQYEPKKALVAPHQGLYYYQQLAALLPEKLNPHALGWLEIGQGQRQAIEALFVKTGLLTHCEKDWSGHERFFLLETDRSHGVSLTSKERNNLNV